MISDKKVLLRVGKVLKACECLGLVHEYVRVGKMGVFTRVWSFAHLSLQEFTGAIWLRSTSWRDQCLSLRFIVHTNDVFSLFRMVVRFFCGLLSDQSMNVYPLLYKHVPPRPVPIHQLPECVQLRFEDDLFDYTDWKEFTETYLQLSELLFESNSDSIPNYFNECRRFIPNTVCFYILSPVNPNEWICFLESLPLLNIHLIYIETDYVTPEKLFNLLESIRHCSVGCLALKFSSNVNTEFLAYTNAIQCTHLSRGTKLCLDLPYCKLTKTVKSLSTCSANQILSGLCLYEFPPDSLRLLSNQISTCQNLKYSPANTSDCGILFSALSSATHINGLHLYDISTEFHQQLFPLLPTLPNIREITWDSDFNIYSPLPFISHLSTVSYLKLRGYLQIPYKTLLHSMLQLLHSNRHSIRVLELWYLEDIGFSSLDGFLNSLQFCTNLVQLELAFSPIRCDDVTLWCTTVQKLTSLLYLRLSLVSLRDSGLLSLCKGLVSHSTIRFLEIRNCKLSSHSCKSLTNLIPTLSQLKTLRVNGLIKPETEPLDLLKLTTDQNGITYDFD